MSDQSDDVDQHAGVPESDPDHIDPAGDLADLLDDQLADAELGEDTDADDVRAFVDAAERGELGPADPALEAQVRIARSILEAVDGGEGDQDQSDDGGPARVRSALYDRLEVSAEFVDGDGGRVVAELVDALE